MEANFDSEHSKWGTRGQLAGGTVEGQLDENVDWINERTPESGKPVRRGAGTGVPCPYEL